jgi:hypothetical protein
MVHDLAWRKNHHAHRFFHLGGTCTLLPSFLGVQIFGGAMYPLTLHLGVQRKLTAFSPRKVMHHAFFCKYYTVGEKKKILVEKMQLIFFVPPNEELEGTLHPQKFGCTPKNEGKRVHVPPK